MIVTRRWARDAMDAAASGVNNARRNASSVRRSRVVLAPRPWRLSTPACAGVATVTKNAAHRGEHEGNRQTIARGKPVRLAELVVNLLGCFFLLPPRLRVQLAPGFPCALSPE